MVTAEQLTALQTDLQEVIGRYRGAGQGDPEARRVQVWTFAQPSDPRPPGSGDEPGA